MIFNRVKKESSDIRYSVYMVNNNSQHFVCEMIDDNSDEAKALNELGLTLRARLTRSRGKYAMLEGSIFNPERLLDAVCSVTDFKTEEFKGGEYKRGYTLLTVTADNCTNKYLVFSQSFLDTLLETLRTKKA